MISSWFQFIPILRPITLILKTHLCKHELNQNYNRGLNTYALIVMLISCIKYLRLEQTQNIAEVL
jgi:DNA polymerase sigma